MKVILESQKGAMPIARRLPPTRPHITRHVSRKSKLAVDAVAIYEYD